MESRFNLEEILPVGVPRQEQVVAVGRICCESAEGKINRASILLEVRIFRGVPTDRVSWDDDKSRSSRRVPYTLK